MSDDIVHYQESLQASKEDSFSLVYLLYGTKILNRKRPFYTEGQLVSYIVVLADEKVSVIKMCTI